jgi:hypothetical protein
MWTRNLRTKRPVQVRINAAREDVVRAEGAEPNITIKSCCFLTAKLRKDNYEMDY